MEFKQSCDYLYAIFFLGTNRSTSTNSPECTCVFTFVHKYAVILKGAGIEGTMPLLSGVMTVDQQGMRPGWDQHLESTSVPSHFWKAVCPVKKICHIS